MPRAMNMSGELPYTIDLKGRMSFPQSFREILGERLVLTRGAERCIIVYSEERWLTLVDKIAEMAPGKKKEDMKKAYVKGASVVETDKLGRILVPQILREYAGLIKDVYVVGSLDVAEIWDKSAYEESIKSLDPDSVYSAMEELG